MADGVAVGAKNVGQEFTEDYFMWSRPSAYHYNTYYEEDTDGDGQVEQYYNDGSAFAGLSSGSNNYAPSNPALAERVEADIAAFLEKNPEAEFFVPDEARIMDRDRLFYLMTLLYRGRLEEVVTILDEAKRNGHICSNQINSQDSYAYIRQWCEKKTVECCSVNNKNRKLCFPFDITHCFLYLCNRKRTVDYGI